ncbi:MAG TPA: hypothetical protein DHV12_07030 [Thermotogae bacterium]|nr:hypothetical protein [Thermotogota bacterium]
MKKVCMIIICFLASVLVFGLAGQAHAFMQYKVLTSLNIPAQYEQLLRYNRLIDTVPGHDTPGGWYHRMRGGHDPSDLKKFVKDKSINLSPTQKKIAWAIHVLQDSGTKEGVLEHSVVYARKILSKEFFKLSFFRSLKYITVMVFLDFVYQITFSNFEIKETLISSLKKYALNIGATTGAVFLVSKIYPYIYSQSSKLLLFSSGLIGAIMYIAADVTVRSIKSESLLESFFSPQTLFNLAFTALFFVPGGQYVSLAIAVFMGALGMLENNKEQRTQFFSETFSRKYEEYLFKQAEMSVK